MLKNIKEYKSTIVGIVSIILFGLVGFNIISADESSEIGLAISQLIDATGGDLIAFLVTLFGTLSGVLHVFSKDPKKEE
jgi:hypothetical protein